jgi:long-subunit fatty acid transport protein
MHWNIDQRISLCFFVAVTSVGLRAYPLEETVGVGPRAQGMAGTGVAVSKDHSAVYYNPADLSYCQRHSLTVSDIQVTPHFSLDDGGPTPHQIKSSNIASLGACIVLPHGFNLGFYAAMPTKAMATMKLMTATDAPRMNMYTEDLLTPSIFAGLSYRILKELSVGVSATMPIHADVKQLAHISGPENRVNAEIDNVISSGVGLVFGVAAEPLKDWRLGLSYRSAMYGRFEAVAMNQPTVIENVTLPIDVVMDGVFAFSPHQVAFGTSYTFFDSLVIATNVTWSHWSKYKGPFMRLAPLSFFAKLAEFPNEPLDYTDNVSIRLGSEYTWNKLVAARVGYAYKPRTLGLPAKETNVLDGNLHTVTAGVTYHIVSDKEWFLDVHLHGAVDILPWQDVNKDAESPENERVRITLREYSFGGVAWNVGAAITAGF